MIKAARWPERLRLLHRRAGAAQRLLRHSTIAPRNCNICGYEGPFYPVDTPPRLDAGCASCKCLERHRLLKLWADDNPAQLQGRAILHFAPERSALVHRAAGGELHHRRYRSAKRRPRDRYRGHRPP